MCNGYRTGKGIVMSRIVTTLLLFSSVTVAAQQARDGAMVEWPVVGADQAASKYSPLTDINVSNVEDLEIVWGKEGSSGSAGLSNFTASGANKWF